MVTLKNITLQRDTKLLFKNTDLVFYNNQKIGIVGKNGCGKTSLFMLIQGKLEPNAGEITMPAKLLIAEIEQEIPQTSRFAIEYVIDADIKLRKYEQNLIAAQNEHNGQKIAEIYELLENIDGFTANIRAAKILHGLGFTEQTMNQPVNALSGGWRMRLNIARALFVTSDILLLDEPTNHLDLDAVIWLEKWLVKYSGLLLLISHDREFLDRVTTQIAHIENQQIKLYAGNYSSFEKQRIAALALQQKQHEKQQKQIEHIESFIKRFRAKASKARQAQSRIKALERMREILPAHIDSPFSFAFKKPEHLANPLLNLKNVSFGYNNDLVLKKINLQLNVQDRIGLLGKNGAGKSTLIKLIAGNLIPKEGTISKNKKLKIGYFAQHVLELLDEENNALQELSKLTDSHTDQELRKFLGGFDFSGDMVLMPIRNLSGGEKARLALALIVWQSPDILLLDEPTNHLDIDMRQALVLALQDYDGAVIVVSHDRFLLRQVVDQYWLVNNGTVQPFAGGLDQYQNQQEKDPGFAAVTPQKRPKPKVNAKNKILDRLERKIAQLQQSITNIDNELVTLSANASQHYAKIKQLQIDRAHLQKQIQQFEEEWLASHN